MISQIGTLRESSLHAELKQLYSQPNDILEEKVGDSIIDIVRGDMLIEIQTGSFSALKKKFDLHLAQYRMMVVYPIAVKKHILRIANNGNAISDRKSPKTGRIEEIFNELTSIVNYATNPHFLLEVSFIKEETVWIDDGRGSWRRKGWSIYDRRLVEVVGHTRFEHVTDYSALLPMDLHQSFTSYDLAEAAGLRRSLAGRMIYCLRQMDLIRAVGKKGHYTIYDRC